MISIVSAKTGEHETVSVKSVEFEGASILNETTSPLGKTVEAGLLEGNQNHKPPPFPAAPSGPGPHMHTPTPMQPLG